MLVCPDDTRVRLLAIDPGTTTLGIAVLDVYPDTRKVVPVYVDTVIANDNHEHYRQIGIVHGNRHNRLYQHNQNVLAILEEYNPHYVIHENPFKGKFVDSFAALTACIAYIKMACFEYNPFLFVDGVDPVTVKKNLGIKLGGGRSKERKDKDLVYQHVLAREDIDSQYLVGLDEHSSDAVAVGLYFIDKYLYIL